MAQNDQIDVRAGDMIGVHYPNEAEAGNKGVLYYEDTRSVTFVTMSLFDRAHKKWK